ncbi:hypothetical protein [Marinagarivorans algicola]|uniref:hypothetical protein n=1 Tax=Marinagarivorans algicola TaxID=1513270 RepID=UPI0006B44163|nr:hypothetical protein [Marinagarivorans algicola]
MGLEILEGDMSLQLMQQDIDDFVEQESDRVMGVDSRRRLENKIDELRLLREMKEFDFDG